LQGSASGTVVYVETQTPTTNANGLVSIEIGGGAGFSIIDWSAGPYFIKTETDPTGGTTYSIPGTSQLLSVPYALHAKTAESITGTVTEADPIFGASPANGITSTNITNWTTAFGWGNHATAGYLTSFTEADPVFAASVASGVTGTDTTNWNNKQDQLTAGTGIDITGNVINATGGGGFTHYVGELYGGGIIVLVWKESGVEHGLIASLTDQSASLIWTTVAYQSVTVPGGATSPIDGLANSNAIVAQAGAGTTYAAGLCRAYSATGDGGLNDWYLPAAWELNQCYNAAFVANTILGATNGFQFAYYWSSTEYSGNSAWIQYFGSGLSNPNSKDGNYRVRAVRRF